MPFMARAMFNINKLSALSRNERYVYIKIIFQTTATYIRATKRKHGMEYDCRERIPKKQHRMSKRMYLPVPAGTALMPSSSPSCTSTKACTNALQRRMEDSRFFERSWQQQQQQQQQQQGQAKHQDKAAAETRTKILS